MTERQPETQPLRKIRSSPTLPPGESHYWETHVVVCGPDDDACFAECADSLDAWIAAGCRHG